MIPRFSLALAAVAALVAVAPAHAVTYNLGTIAPGTSNGQVVSRPPGQFSDNFLFRITLSGNDGKFQYTNFLVSNFSNIINATLNYTGPTTGSFFFDGTQGMVEQTVALAGGDYTATLSGTANGSDGGAYNFRVTAPTPEPELWLSMIAGVGLAGFWARRRKATSAPLAA